MKKLVLLCFIILSAPLFAQVTLVQTSPMATGAWGTTTATPTLATASGSGHMLIEVDQYSRYNSSPRTIVVTSPNSVWHQMSSVSTISGGNDLSNGQVEMWCAIPSAPETAVTVTQTDSGQPFLAVLMEVAGGPSSCGAISQIAANTATTSTFPYNTPSLTPSQPGSLPISWFITPAGVSFTSQSAGWTFAANNGPPAYPFELFGVSTHLATSGAIANTYSLSVAGQTPNGAVAGIALVPPYGTLPVVTAGGTLANGTAQRAYSSSVSCSGGLSPYTVTATGLPSGLSFTGVTLSGQPTVAGTYTPSITCSDSSSPVASSAVTTLPSFTLAPTPPLAITNTSFTRRAGQFFDISLQPTGGSQVYSTTWTGTLPPNTYHTGVFNSGLVTAALGTTQGTYSLGYTVTDTSSPALSISGTLTLTIGPANPPVPVSAFKAMGLGTNGAFNGVVASPDDAWHADVSTAEVDATSNLTMNVSPAGFGHNYIHHDWGTDYGIPYTVVDSTQTNIPFVLPQFQKYPKDSEQTGYPLIYPSQSIESGYATCPFSLLDGDNGQNGDFRDHHSITVDRGVGVSYEQWVAFYCLPLGWASANGALWDLTKTEIRPYAATSVDAAGLSVLAGLLTYEEATAGTINHASRFTAKFTQNDNFNGTFVAPATHAAGTSGGAGNVPGNIPIIGERIRLKASFDVSGFSQTNQNILNGWKRYGLILADNGSNLYVQATQDARWNQADLDNLQSIPGTAFEVVGLGPIYNANTAPVTTPPAITGFTASATSVTAGTPVTLNLTASNATYTYTSCTGLVRNGTTTFTPAATTTCTGYAGGQTAPNRYGDEFFAASSPITITVSSTPPPPAAPLTGGVVIH